MNVPENHQSAGPTLTSSADMPNNGDSGTAERRMARYKEERRRQLASQIAGRIKAEDKGGS